MNIFVGNLAFAATEADVIKLFEGFGKVTSAVIVMEKKQAKSRGFGFVEMTDEQEAQAAIMALNGKEFMGRVINVNPARPKAEADRIRQEKKEARLKIKAKAKQPFTANPIREHKPLNTGFSNGAGKPEGKKWFTPVFERTGRYKEGRRSRSFVMKRVASGINEPIVSKPKNKANPMRWRKKTQQPKPWQKAGVGESKPWQEKREYRPMQKEKTTGYGGRSRVKSRGKPSGYKPKGK